MSTWNQAGPVVAEVDGTAENLRVVDFASAEALRSGAKLVLVAPYAAHGSFSPRMPGYSPKSPAELADSAVREAVTHVRQRDGYATEVAAITDEGSRLPVLAHAAQNARMLVVGRSKSRGPQRLVHAQANLTLAARAGVPVVVVPLSWRPSPADGKVAVGTDGTPLSAEALEFASAVAAVREADLIVVRAGLLVRESCDAGLVVVGSRTGGLPTDPVVRRSVAAMTCPVAIVPHRLTRVEWERLQSQTAARRGALVLPTY